MRSILRFALLSTALPCLLVHLASAQSGSTISAISIGHNPAGPLATGSVTGHIYCGDTHRPARMARIRLHPVPVSNPDRTQRLEQLIGNGTSSETGMDGEFNIQHVKPGTYYLSVSFPGYVDPANAIDSTDLWSKDEQVLANAISKLQTLQVDNGSTRADVTLERGGSLTGTVHYDDGSPAANVHMMVLKVNQNGKTAPVTFGTTLGQPVTDDRGVFRLTSLPPGTYYVVAQATLPKNHPGLPRKVGDREIPMPSLQSILIFAPSSFGQKGATPYEVGYGEERDSVEVTLNFTRLHTVSGSISGLPGNKTSYVYLRDVSTDSGYPGGTSIGADGTFYIENVPDGSYQLSVNRAKAPKVNINVHGSDVNGLTLSAASETAQQ